MVHRKGLRPRSGWLAELPLEERQRRARMRLVQRVCVCVWVVGGPRHLGKQFGHWEGGYSGNMGGHRTNVETICIHIYTHIYINWYVYIMDIGRN